MTSILNHPACIFLGKVNSCPPEDKSRATCPICASYRISFKHSFFNLLIEWRSDAHPVHKYAIGMNKKFEQACFSECWTFFFVCHVYSNVFYSIETEKNALEFSCSEVKGFLIVSRFTLKGTLDYTFWRKYSWMVRKLSRKTLTTFEILFLKTAYLCTRTRLYGPAKSCFVYYIVIHKFRCKIVDDNNWVSAKVYLILKCYNLWTIQEFL